MKDLDVNIRDMDGRTALFYFCLSKKSDILAEFLKLKGNEIDFNVIQKAGKTCLMELAEQDDKTSIAILIKYAREKIDINLAPPGESGVLFRLIRTERTEILSMLLSSFSETCDFNQVDDEGLTMSALSCKLDRGELLVELGKYKEKVNVNVEDKNGMTTTHWACLASTETLVHFGRFWYDTADVNASDHLGRTPLMLCALAAKLSELKLLWRIAGSKLDTRKRDNEGNDVFLIAVGVSEECVDTVLSCFGESLDMNIQNNMQETWLIRACRLGNENVVHQLSVHVVAPILHATDSYGRTALHYAVESELVEVVDLLIKCGAEPGVLDKMNTSPVGVAVKTRNLECMALLFLSLLVRGYPKTPVLKKRELSKFKSAFPFQGLKKLDATRVLVIGSNDSGKSSVVQSLLDKGKPVSPHRSHRQSLGLCLDVKEATYGSLHMQIHDFGELELYLRFYRSILHPGPTMLLLVIDPRVKDSTGNFVQPTVQQAKDWLALFRAISPDGKLPPVFVLVNYASEPSSNLQSFWIVEAGKRAMEEKAALFVEGLNGDMDLDEFTFVGCGWVDVVTSGLKNIWKSLLDQATETARNYNRSGHVPEIYFQVFDTCLSRIMEEKGMLHDIAGKTSDYEGELFSKNRARMPIMSTAQLCEIATLMLGKKEEHIPCMRRLVNQCISYMCSCGIHLVEIPMKLGGMESIESVFTHDTREGSFVFLSSRFFAGLVNLFAEKERQCSGIGLLREIDTFHQIHVHYPVTDVELSLRIISEFGMFCEPLRLEGMICHKFGPSDPLPDAAALDKMIASISKGKSVWKTRDPDLDYYGRMIPLHSQSDVEPKLVFEFVFVRLQKHMQDNLFYVAHWPMGCAFTIHVGDELSYGILSVRNMPFQSTTDLDGGGVHHSQASRALVLCLATQSHALCNRLLKVIRRILSVVHIREEFFRHSTTRSGGEIAKRKLNLWTEIPLEDRFQDCVSGRTRDHMTYSGSIRNISNRIVANGLHMYLEDRITLESVKEESSRAIDFWTLRKTSGFYNEFQPQIVGVNIQRREPSRNGLADIISIRLYDAFGIIVKPRKLSISLQDGPDDDVSPLSFNDETVIMSPNRSKVTLILPADVIDTKKWLIVHVPSNMVPENAKEEIPPIRIAKCELLSTRQTCFFTIDPPNLTQESSILMDLFHIRDSECLAHLRASDELLSLSVFTRKWEDVLLGRFERDLWEHTRPSSLLMHRLRLLSARYHTLLEKDFLPSFKDRLEKVVNAQLVMYSRILSAAPECLVSSLNLKMVEGKTEDQVSDAEGTGGSEIKYKGLELVADDEKEIEVFSIPYNSKLSSLLVDIVLINYGVWNQEYGWKTLCLVGIDREALQSMVLLDIASVAKHGRCTRIQASIPENDDTMKTVMTTIANGSPHILHFRLVGETRITAELYCLVEIQAEDHQQVDDSTHPKARRKRALCHRSWFEDFPQISQFKLEGLVNVLSFEDSKMVLIDRSRDAAMFRI
eukprot:TRINITY_DN406_c0_g1_i1.p1 TRINITY_DN406_c0_g1~~TRINITY_DN406_c0_g1_i1.p1  ORF type:complete len:1738 (+),score=367.19 TRINITY_DN406_c0_g1_i1:752-5215(+)